MAWPAKYSDKLYKFFKAHVLKKRKLLVYGCKVALAEWLRRVPAKYMGLSRESSNLSGVVSVLSLYYFKITKMASPSSTGNKLPLLPPGEAQII